MKSLLRKTSIVLIGILFIVAGINHFINPKFYTNITPPYLPAHLTLVFVSGVFEVLGGLGVLSRQLRRAAGWGLIALLIAVSPVHFHMLANSDDYANVPYWVLVARLLFQVPLIAWTWWATLAKV